MAGCELAGCGNMGDDSIGTVRVCREHSREMCRRASVPTNGGLDSRPGEWE